MRKVVSVLLLTGLACMIAVNVASAKESAKVKFAKLDTNGDGKVTKEEYIAGNPNMDKDKAAARFAKIAKGKDSFNLDDFKAYLKAQEKKKEEQKDQKENNKGT